MPEPNDTRRPLLLTFDVEEFTWPLELGHSISVAEQLAVTRRGLNLVLPILARHRTPATFFVTGTFAAAEAAGVAEIVSRGHEVGVHGLSHADDYASMPLARAIERLRRARDIVAQAAGQALVGVRTPRLRVCAGRVLSEAGFAYDASVHPTWVWGRYHNMDR